MISKSKTKQRIEAGISVV